LTAQTLGSSVTQLPSGKQHAPKGGKVVVVAEQVPAQVVWSPRKTSAIPLHSPEIASRQLPVGAQQPVNLLQQAPVGSGADMLAEIPESAKSSDALARNATDFGRNHLFMEFPPRISEIQI